jgi:tetratricopeptide (TPR) repeat protein
MHPETSADIRTMIEDALRHHQAGRLVEAGEIYRRILSVDPHHADSLHLLGMVAFQSGDSDTAVELIRRAIAIHSGAASYYSNLGNVLQAQGKLAEAGACYQRALVVNPELPEVYLNLGNIFRALGELDSSLACHRRALALNPDLAEAAAAEAMVLLMKGDYARGWRNFERRWQTRDYDTAMRDYPQPYWTGEALAPGDESGRVLIWGEQGIGDEIMFAGLIPDVMRTETSCVLDCDARLKPLFARSFPGVEVISGGGADDPKPDFAAHLPSGSLPGIFRASKAAFAETTSPYLFADAQARSRLRSRYADGSKLIGLAWHTRNKKTGPQRSIDLSLLTSVFARPGVRWVSLQYGDHDELEAQAAAAHAPLLVDREVDQLADMDTFAAQVAAMDLVITIDNSTAHLSGALGVPTWVLLPFAPDWRWMESGDGSPWYPTMRLFRQTLAGDWVSVVRRVGLALSVG